MAMAPLVKVIFGSIAFAVFWVLAVFPSFPFLPIGRTAGSLLGAVLMVAFQILDPQEAYFAIDLQILGLLFGTMVISIYLEGADLFEYLGGLLSWKSGGPKDLMCRICLVSALSSAFFTNDTSCMVLTEFVLGTASQKNLPPHPFLLALASSANIRSSATPIGNPQNLVIAVKCGKLTFGAFMVGILPAMLAGVVLNALILLCMYWRLLSVPDNDKVEPGEAEFDDLRLALLIGSPSLNQAQTEPHHPVRESGMCSNESEKWKTASWKTCVDLVAIVMVVLLLLGLNMSWTAIGAALTLMVLNFKDAQPSLEKVSYSLLTFFCGMFITVEGFRSTGIPPSLRDYTESYAQINRASGIAVLALIILLISNVVSNVPTVLLLGARVAASAAAISEVEEKKAWLILAWVSTVAGNLTLLGSAANLIVCEQARRSPRLAYNLTFWSHLKFGIPSTLIVTAVGLTLIR